MFKKVLYIFTDLITPKHSNMKYRVNTFLLNHYKYGGKIKLNFSTDVSIGICACVPNRLFLKRYMHC